MSEANNETLLERIIELEKRLCEQYKETTHARINACKFEQQLEATRAELAAERANPKGGVAWALMSKTEDDFVRFIFADIKPLFSSQLAACQYIDAHAKRGQWYAVPYPLGDGADELKAAIERAEKAEEEVAAWKAAANFGRSDNDTQSPENLQSRIKILKDDCERHYAQRIALSRELDALKLAPAEVPPLDKWRVLATAKVIAQHEFHEAESDSMIEPAWISAQNALQILLKLAGQDKACRYEIR